MSSMITKPPHRNVELDELRRMLTDQSTHALDVKTGAGRMRAVGGSLVLDGTEPQLGPDGVTMTSGTYTINDVATAGLADKLGIPVAYLRRLAAEHPDLFDHNVNGWLARDPRSFLIRCLRNDTGGGSCGRSCPTDTTASTTLTSSSPPSTGSAARTCGCSSPAAT